MRQMEVHTGMFKVSVFNIVTKCYLGTCVSRPAGQGLVELFKCDPVQSFFSGLSPKDLHPEKAIYTPSILRKVYFSVINVSLTVNTMSFALQFQGRFKLGCVPVLLDSGNHAELHTLPLSLPSDLHLESEVSVYGGIISHQHQLVGNGDFVRITASQHEVRNAKTNIYVNIHV